MIRAYRPDGLERLVLESDEVRVTCLPELGGKIVELTHIPSGTQFLLGPQGSGYRRASYGAAFSAYPAGGFDDCFPTVEAAGYMAPSPNGQTEPILFPDHGEVWSLPWQWRQERGAVVLSTRGVRARYDLLKRLRVERNRLVLDYTVRNTGDRPFPYLWSAHPLLAVDEGDRLLLPPGIGRVLLDWASRPGFGRFGDQLSWPDLGQAVDLTRVPSASVGFAVKVFTPRLARGRAGLFRKAKNASILFEFDAAELPYLGVWLCYGSSDSDAREQQYTVALEPTTGRPDSVRHALARGEGDVLEVGEERRWTLAVSLWVGPPPPDGDGATATPGHVGAARPELG